MKNFGKPGQNPSWRLNSSSWLLVLAMFCSSAAICAADEQMMAVTPVATPDAAKATSYLPPGQPDAALLLASPPLPGSPEQAADMAEVVAVHAACTTNEAAVAFAEKKFSIFTFTSVIGDFFQPGKFPKTEAFFQRVQTDAELVTDASKDFFRRPRPFTVNPALATGKMEKSFSYPSGHSTEGTVLALVLADLFPDHKDAILAEGRSIGWHRVLIARHYPTDIHAGRMLAQAIVRELKASAAFRQDFAEAKAEIAAAQK